MEPRAPTSHGWTPIDSKLALVGCSPLGLVIDDAGIDPSGGGEVLPAIVKDKTGAKVV
jgi:hypothetical protein